jgi:putative FmdB family regulatory protein
VPIYDYVCSNCRHRIEVIHGINVDGPRFCPSCGAEGTMRKALTTPAVHFKGSGWAKKDRSSTSGTRTKAAASSSGSSDSPDSSGSGDGSRDGGGSDGKGAAAEASSGGTESAKAKED